MRGRLVSQVLQPTGAPSKVILLRNMVGPGEVDEGLEDEVAEEVAKFGDVLRVLIFQVSGPVAREQAVCGRVGSFQDNSIAVKISI